MITEVIDTKFENNFRTFEQKIDSKFEENFKIFEQKIDTKFENNFKIFEEKMDSKFAENNKMTFEAIDGVINSRIREAVIPLELKINTLLGMFKDLISGQTQTMKLSQTVEVNEETIQNNILPRLDILEKQS